MNDPFLSKVEVGAKVIAKIIALFAKYELTSGPYKWRVL